MAAPMAAPVVANPTPLPGCYTPCPSPYMPGSNYGGMGSTGMGGTGTGSTGMGNTAASSDASDFRSVTSGAGYSSSTAVGYIDSAIPQSQMPSVSMRPSTTMFPIVPRSSMRNAAASPALRDRDRIPMPASIFRNCPPTGNMRSTNASPAS